jgi:glycerol-3-phosphate dehydrogenase
MVFFNFLKIIPRVCIQILNKNFFGKEANKKNFEKIFFLDIRRHFREHGNKIDERLLHELLNEVDLNKNGELELAEFFQVLFLFF